MDTRKNSLPLFKARNLDHVMEMAIQHEQDLGINAFHEFKDSIKDIDSVELIKDFVGSNIRSGHPEYKTIKTIANQLSSSIVDNFKTHYDLEEVHDFGARLYIVVALIRFYKR